MLAQVVPRLGGWMPYEREKLREELVTWTVLGRICGGVSRMTHWTDEEWTFRTELAL